MRIATYNVEWFASLFDDSDALINDTSWSGRHDITKSQQTAALATVFRAIDADAVMIIEAPDTNRSQSTTRALENFARHAGLRQRKAVMGFENDTQQEIALLFDPDKMSAEHAPKGTPDDSFAPRFDTSLLMDLDVDAEPDPVVWSKPPLEVRLKPTHGAPLRLIGVHAKSKAPHGARNPREAVRISISNRRKQLAQCIWLRRRIDAHLAQNEPLIVLGDLNDGPGLDEYEKLFGRSGLEIVLGAGKPSPEQLTDPHASAAMQPRAAAPTTARFYNHKTKRFLNALLDYVMLSPDLTKTTNPRWKIWHPFDTPDCHKDTQLSEALLRASDHFPVTVDLDLPDTI